MIKGKIKPMEIGKTMVGASAGAYIGEVVADKVVDMVDSDMAETGALIVLSALGAYVETTQQGMIASAGAGLCAEVGKTVLKKYIGGGDASPAPAPASKPSPRQVKGVENEIGEIYNEISEALSVRGANDPIITGNNDPIITGYDDIDGFDDIEGLDDE